MNKSDRVLPPLVIGEVLFDHFPDGKRVLGGAPLNVAWNLQGLGTSSVFLSAVGNDDEGRLIRQTMSDWSMGTQGLQTSQRPTGRVSVTMVDGQPQYEIVEGMAFDFIERPEFVVDTNSFSMMCYGSLAFRSVVSRQTITDLIQQTSLPRFVDINIRDPFFDEAWLDTLIGDARWVKLSEGELSRLVDAPCENESQIVSAAHALRGRYRIDTVLVTCGPGGAYGVGEDLQTHAPVAPLESIVDTVGAGDAFAAATIAGLLQSRSLDEVLPIAVRFASKVCGLKGATTDDRSFYEGFL